MIAAIDDSSIVFLYLLIVDNLLEKRFFTSNEKTVIQIGSETISCSPKFRLYLITKEENSASNLELASRVALETDIFFQ